MVTRKDINEIQLAKSAIRAAVEILLQEAGLHSSDLDSFIVAGAFGTYLDLRSAIRTGMFPALPQEKFHQVGNAAGVGAKQMLISVDKTPGGGATCQPGRLHRTDHPARLHFLIHGTSLLYSLMIGKSSQFASKGK